MYDLPISLLDIFSKNEKHKFEKIHTPLCSSQHYWQLPWYKQSKCPSRMNGYRICDIYTQDIYNGILFNHKKKEILLFTTKWMGLKGVMLSEINQRQISYDFASIWNIF